MSLHELEFNDLNIHLYLTLNYETASEHLDLDSMVLYNAFVLSWGLTITQNSIHTISDLDRSCLSDTRSAENDRIGADTDPEYRIDASLVQTADKNITIIHTTPIHQLTSGEDKSWNKSSIKMFLTKIQVHNL